MPAAVRDKPASGGAKEKALSAAQTKFKNVLLRTNAQEDRLLNTELSKLEKEKRRRFTHSTQEQRSFLLRCNQQPEPSIIVERAPSPDNMRKAYIMTHGLENEFEDELYRRPHYMRPLKTRNKTPSTLATIDVYTVKTRKKMNIWEDTLVAKNKLPKFVSMVVPSNPLSRPETVELNRGWEIQRTRRKSPSAQVAISTRPDDVRQPIRSGHRPRTMPAPRRRVVQATKTFITEFATRPDDAGGDDQLSIAESASTSHAVNDVIRANKTVSLAGGEAIDAGETQAKRASEETTRPFSATRNTKKPITKTAREGEIFVDDDTKDNIQRWLKSADVQRLK